MRGLAVVDEIGLRRVVGALVVLVLPVAGTCRCRHQACTMSPACLIEVEEEVLSVEEVAAMEEVDVSFKGETPAAPLTDWGEFPLVCRLEMFLTGWRVRGDLVACLRAPVARRRPPLTTVGCLAWLGGRRG
jgi:hypothetical protein